MPARASVTLGSLAIPVTSAENRAVSFTNKQSAYYYTQTHHNDHPEHAWFRGLNIAGRRVFSDYTLFANGRAIDAATASVIVRPDAMVRTYPDGMTETVRLFDNVDALAVSVAGSKDSIDMVLYGDGVKGLTREKDIEYFISANPADSAHPDYIAVSKYAGDFVLAVAPSVDSARTLYNKVASHIASLQTARVGRLSSLVNDDRYLWTDNARLTQSLRWITITTDELVTKQRGDGIYAGLPWFNEYWGRDSFISLAGATLVTGHFAEARAILTSFAKFQDLDNTSPFFGRVPNIVKPGSVDYHTTDGTPRWVIALRDYVAYSGDVSIIAELYTNIAASIEGALAHFTDASGYLVHADNETWMDARREPDHASYSPRGTRANDIQALWFEQLQAGAQFAHTQHDSAAAARWSAAAARVQSHFVHDFVNASTGQVADHLDSLGRADYTLRPNALFAMTMMSDSASAIALRTTWNGLVYPWGVATLGQDDAFFHPFHVAWEHYHKDEAYHNGTVWLWLNGMAEQRMIERGETESAWQLFQHTSDMALTRGVVGGLAETMDAYPHSGEPEPRLTGTFLQAWSNAEHLRVWYQFFIGVRPDLMHGNVLLAPRMPVAVRAVDATVPIGHGSLQCVYESINGARRFTYRLRGQTASLTLDIAPYQARTFAVKPGDELVALVMDDGVHVTVGATGAAPTSRVLLAPSPARQANAAFIGATLHGASFARPRAPESHDVMSKVYRRGAGN